MEINKTERLHDFLFKLPAVNVLSSVWFGEKLSEN